MDSFKDVEEFKEVKDDRKKFLNNQRILLTYKNHLDKAKLKEFFESKCNTIVFWRAAHESGDKKNPYLHTHVVVDFKKPFQSTSCRVFDYEGIHPHIQRINSNAHFKRAKRYLSKEDPGNKDLENEDPTWFEQVESKKTIQEALNLASSPAQATGIALMFLNKTKKFDRPQIKLYPWQEKLVEELKGPASDRSIIWIYDPIGCMGKSKLAEYCYLEKPNNICFLQSMPGSRDVATIIMNSINSGWNGHALLVDLTRSQGNRDSIYEPLEMIKNGWLTAIKYQGQMCPIPKIPHIICFANWTPNISKMTRDRWDIRIPQGEILTDRGYPYYKDPSTIVLTPFKFPLWGNIVDRPITLEENRPIQEPASRQEEKKE